MKTKYKVFVHCSDEHDSGGGCDYHIECLLKGIKEEAGDPANYTDLIGIKVVTIYKNIKDYPSKEYYIPCEGCGTPIVGSKPT